MEKISITNTTNIKKIRNHNKSTDLERKLEVHKWWLLKVRKCNTFSGANVWKAQMKISEKVRKWTAPAIIIISLFQEDHIFGTSASLTYSPQFHASMIFRRKRFRRIHYFDYDIPSNTTLGKSKMKVSLFVTTKTSLCACRFILLPFTDRCNFNFVAPFLIENGLNITLHQMGKFFIS